MSTDDLLQRRYRLLGEGSPLFYDRPLHIVRGDGVWLFEADGRRYLDAYNNVPHVGHCHPRVVDAIARQAATLNIHTRYLHENILEYAERLTATFDESLSMVLFACTGSEANDVAMQMARLCTGNQGFIATDFAYHGNTTAVWTVSSFFTGSEERGPGVRTVPAPDSYRVPAGLDGADLGEAYARTVKEAVDALEAAGAGVAGIIFDTIYSSEGLPHVPAGYVDQAIEHVRAAGGLYIADEVQPGFGRMGDHLWGYQHYGVVPDIVTLGKPMGNGHPISGVVARPDLVQEFGSSRMYFNTFGGNPVSCAAALAVLDVLEEEKLVAHAREVGEYVQHALRELQQRHSLIGDIRGRGLFFGAELVRDRETLEPATTEARRLVNAMREQGVLISRIGKHDNILKMRPPMPFAKEHADLLVSVLDDCLKELS
ncbi:MAG TPA: aminotransferase class III-fold pyridoxal phosphate-dependent enzyme [Woeseiaceae bacterium]|nr:aminotransferase class III-fold pyridoxal phosphate-dependent enzyme [Woeseiaceae bacterium]